MKRLFCAALLGMTLAVPFTSAQDSGPSKPPKDTAQAAEKAAKQKAKDGADCDANRAGVRCNRPKPRKPWFFGKA
jgi:hypothetical protein